MLYGTGCTLPISVNGKISARAHAEFFKDIKPCATMVEVKGFIHPDMIVEIETEAIAD